MFPKLPEGTSVSMLQPLLEHIDRATSRRQVMRVMANDYGQPGGDGLEWRWQ